MKAPRRLKFVGLGLALVLATALGYGAYLLSRLAPIGTAYAAKTLCSGVYVAGRPAPDVIREDIVRGNHPLLRLITPSLDAQRRMATAAFLGLARRDAEFHAGLGCTLAIGTPAAAASAGSIADAAMSGAHPACSEDLSAGTPGAGVDASKLRAAVDWAFAEPDAAKLRRTRAVVVLHDGRIVAERYAPGFCAATPMPGWSMTKTVAAVLIGTLVRSGKLSVDQKGLLPEWRSAGDPRAEITLDELLRMTSGLHFTERYGDPGADVMLMLFERADGAGYAIDKPLDAVPGTRWQYSSGTSNILSRVIRRAVGGADQDYLAFPRRALFAPVRMRSAVIEPDASGTFVTSSYMYASARDWARLGQLLLQDGVWEGSRILPPGWVKYMAMLTPQSTRKDFGAHLWLKVSPPFNSLIVPPPKLPPDAFHAIGYEGQFVSVIPSRRLVVVRLGLSRGDHVWDHEAFLARLLDALPR
ncbi:MAG TPA: serine hydrolase [Burkholderiales bacterium]|nr:serine hydrolase [Burkholderiales bacterium]